MSSPDAVVVGSGPNGLAAALTLARSGLEVVVYEGAAQPGGGCRTAELTLPGFRHDVCSTAHPLAVASPFFASVDLAAHGVTLCKPEVAFAHPLDGGRAGALHGHVADTAAALGRDAAAYEKLMGPLVGSVEAVLATVLAPLRKPPRHPVALARYGLDGLPSMRHLAGRFHTEETRGLLAGVGAHAMQPLTAPLTAAFGLLLAMLAHSVGWPVVQGGSSELVRALSEELEALGGRIETNQFIDDLSALPPKAAVLLDTSPNQLLSLGGDRLSGPARRALSRFRYGPGVCKVDWALSGPVPWSASACRSAGTVHLGGTFEEVAASEAAVAAGRHPERPYCLVVQPGIVDPTRAPAGRQTLWGYCHVPSGSTVDMTERIEAQLERFAPGFKDLVLARSTLTAVETEAHNRNYVGGDITGGAGTLRQTIFRPTFRWNPYRTALRGVYLCSASTPPGGGVHGMCGVGAATTVLADRAAGRHRR